MASSAAKRSTRWYVGLQPRARRTLSDHRPKLQCTVQKRLEYSAVSSPCSLPSPSLPLHLLLPRSLPHPSVRIPLCVLSPSLCPLVVLSPPTAQLNWLRKHPRLSVQQREALEHSLLAKMAEGSGERLSEGEYTLWFGELQRAMAPTAGASQPPPPLPQRPATAARMAATTTADSHGGPKRHHHGAGAETAAGMRPRVRSGMLTLTQAWAVVAVAAAALVYVAFQAVRQLRQLSAHSYQAIDGTTRHGSTAWPVFKVATGARQFNSGARTYGAARPSGSSRLRPGIEMPRAPPHRSLSL